MNDKLYNNIMEQLSNIDAASPMEIKKFLDFQMKSNNSKEYITIWIAFANYTYDKDSMVAIKDYCINALKANFTKERMPSYFNMLVMNDDLLLNIFKLCGKDVCDNIFECAKKVYEDDINRLGDYDKVKQLYDKNYPEEVEISLSEIDESNNSLNSSYSDGGDMNIQGITDEFKDSFKSNNIESFSKDDIKETSKNDSINNPTKYTPSDVANGFDVNYKKFRDDLRGKNISLRGVSTINMTPALEEQLINKQAMISTIQNNNFAKIISKLFGNYKLRNVDVAIDVLNNEKIITLDNNIKFDKIATCELKMLNRIKNSCDKKTAPNNLYNPYEEEAEVKNNLKM